MNQDKPNQVFAPHWKIGIALQHAAVKQFIICVCGQIWWRSEVIKPTLVKLHKNHSNPAQLLLELRPAILWPSGNLQEVVYTEKILQSNQYKEVFVYAGNQVLVHQVICEKKI